MVKVMMDTSHLELPEEDATLLEAHVRSLCLKLHSTRSKVLAGLDLAMHNSMLTKHIHFNSGSS